MLQGALLDGDGTLYDTEPWYFEAVRRTFRPYGVEIGQEEYIRRWMLESTGFEGVVQDYGLAIPVERLRTERDEIFLGLLAAEGRLMPYALDLLDRLRTYPLGLVSSAHRGEVERKLGRFGLQDRFQVLVSGDMTPRKKPHPEPYRMGTDQLGVPAASILVVEDNPSGVRSAKAAGCKVVAYPNGFTAGMDFRMADRVVASLAEITDGFLEDLFAP
ncbi:MAG: HAD family phosphatase [Candidatus Aenigmarchaeota archaeon]|nr:HAD family phosphatase [Candidatus Aenigmarchaeota archaeon]